MSGRKLLDPTTYTGPGMNLSVRDDSPTTYHLNSRTTGKHIKHSVSLFNVPDFRKGIALFEDRQILPVGPSDKQQCGISVELQGKFRITCR